MTDGAETEFVLEVFAPGTGQSYDRIVEVTTGGRDREWKEEILGRLGSPRRVLDLACGTGILTFMIRDRFPDAEVVGVDLNPEYLDVARRRSVERGDTRVGWLLGRAEEVELDGEFDVVTSCYLPKYADLPRLVPRLVDRLAPGGLLIMHDFVCPEDPVVRRAWRWGFTQGLDWARRNLPEAVRMFEILPGLIETSRWLEDLTSLLDRYGLEEVGTLKMSHDQVAFVWGRKAPAR